MKKFVAVVLVLVMLCTMVGCRTVTQEHCDAPAQKAFANGHFVAVERFNYDGYPVFYLVYDTNTKAEYLYIVGLDGGISFCPYYDETGDIAIYEGE